jgi:cytidine deaminase
MQYTSVFQNTHLHVATITKRGHEIAISRNRVGSRSRGCGYSNQTIHAERAVVKSLGDVSQLRGCTLTVVRLNKQSEIMYSKPCASCVKFLEKCIRKYGLLKVLYAGSNQGGSKCTHDVSDGDSDSGKDSCSHV